MRGALVGTLAALVGVAGGITGAQAKSKPASGEQRFSVAMAGHSITMSFHGDPATGCADRGLCDTSGTVALTLSGRGSGLALLTASDRTVFALIVQPGSGTTTASVETTGAPDCHDSTTNPLTAFTAFAFDTGPFLVGYGNSGFENHGNNSGSAVSFGSSGGTDAFANRCAGPIDDDYDAAMPIAKVPRSQLGHRTFRADLSGTKSFAAHGFAGTITSDLVLTFKRRQCKGKRMRRECHAFAKVLS